MNRDEDSDRNMNKERYRERDIDIVGHRDKDWDLDSSIIRNKVTTRRISEPQWVVRTSYQSTIRYWDHIALKIIIL